MRLDVTNDSAVITAAINEFREKYHRDYFTARGAAVSYLNQPLVHATAERLALVLQDALVSWGAGVRGAPTCQPVADVTTALCNPSLHRNLNRLAASLPHLALAKGGRSISVSSGFASVVEFDTCLLGTLNDLADGVMVGNTNVTYPMKALLLITGLMPAFDSQVKGGLAIAGVSGVNKTRYLLPRRACADAQKICALPFYISDCVSRALPVLNRAIEDSKFPELKGQHGRLFDVLLFMQKERTAETALIRFTAAQRAPRWYSI